MRKLLFSTVACVIAGASAAFAGSGVDISKSVEIKGKTPAEVMEKFGAFCAIAQWHPAIAKCEESKEGDSHFRTLHLKDGGGAIKELLTKTGADGYSYKIIDGPLPVKDYQANFSIKKDDDGDDVKVTWAASFQGGQGKTDAEAKAVMEGVFEAGLKSLAEQASK